MHPKNNKNTKIEQNELVTLNIQGREVDYIMVSEFELQAINTSANAMDIISEALLMLSTTILGFLLGSFKMEISYIFLGILFFLMMLGGFYLKVKRNETFDNLKKRYKTKYK